MRVRVIEPKPGATVVLVNLENSYHLPKGLTAGTQATYKNRDCGEVIVEVEGTEWRIPMLCIEYKHEYQIGNRWFPADHPEVIKALAARNPKS